MDVRGDFLIIGSGIAGLRAAVALADAGDVAILTKADPAESNTGYAQGGIAAAVGPDDSPDLHAADTIRAGDGLCDEAAVRVLVDEGPRYVRELIEWGAAFDRAADGRPALGREAAHSVRRVLHARDATGRGIGRLLWEKASTEPRVRVLKNALAIEIVVERGRCAGVKFLDPAGDVRVARGRATLIATGGAGQVFRETTNPPIATGDGIALAYRAGARVSDLEFVQFHPTALNVIDRPRFLLSEALRGEGARLINDAGDAFMTRYHPAGDLAPRDIVARGIVREVERTGGPVYLSLAHLDPGFVRGRFPTIAAACRDAGLDLARDRIPVGPAAHYLMGGVETDLDGRTSIPGLFAAGEAACTRVHGANRLASNSLLEGLVFGARAGLAMREPAAIGDLPPPVWAPPASVVAEAPEEMLDAAEIREVMWRSVGLFRDRARLDEALARLERGWRDLTRQLEAGARLDRAGWRRASLLTVGRLIARAARRREESRGGHFRSDFPARDDLHWRLHISEALGDGTLEAHVEKR